ncbi:MAG: ribonuclease E/G [Rhodospirillaceae bacterium]|nr:ribonuclease E/G [Rhodospirillales bacterium]
MATEILYSWGPGESRLAVVRDGRLADLVLVRPELLAGAVILGRVVEVAHKLGAVFVDIGQDKPGFLSAKGLTQGAAVLVQVKADAQGGKGCALTSDVSLAGRCLAYSPFRPGLNVSRKLSDEKRDRLLGWMEPLMQEGEGVVVRTHATTADKSELEFELSQLRADWADIQTRAAQAKAPSVLLRSDPLLRLLSDNPGVARVLVDDPQLQAAARARFGGLIEIHRDGPLFDLYDVEDSIAAACATVVPLACGGRVTIEPTAALTAIDVDSGGATAAEANTQAVGVIARQLRLRNIAGQMVVDFVSGGGKGALFKLVAALKQAVARDPVATHVIGVTPLGLVEMTRERKGPSLPELMQERGTSASADAVAFAALRMALKEAPHRPGRGLAVVVAPDVAAALTRRSEAVAEAEDRLGRKLVIRADSTRAREDVQIEEQQP